MRYKFLKLSIFFTATFLIIGLGGCVKSTNYFTDLSKVNDLVILRNAGIAGFKASNIRVDPTSTDTLFFDVYAELASVEASNSNVTVTLAVDDAKRTAYNTANSTNFQAFSNNKYKLKSTTLTIPAGEHYAKTTLEVYQSFFDPTISFMLPISITDASGKALSSNQNAIYFNVIGNPIAGNYNWDFTRWNSPDNSGTPSSLSFTGHTTTFVADDPTTIEVESGYFIQPRYVVSFTNTSGTLSNFKVSFNPGDLQAMIDNGVTVTSGPNITKADPVTGEYIFWYTTLTRYIIDRYYK